jgi:tRNA1Val (adenine37-N6)-methyltransferase
MFRFKEFSIQDDQCTLKVGTDGILLGAWVEAANAKNILDIGSGCGLIALMLAQKSEKAKIDAVEIDRKSAKQAELNFSSSPWDKRITSLNSSFQDFSNKAETKYDLIVSNPPFFENSLKSPRAKKNLSKHNDQLSFDELLSGAKKLLQPKGKFTLILPFETKDKFIQKAGSHHLFCSHEIYISPKSGKPFHRAILEFRKEEKKKKFEEIIILQMDNNYSGTFKNLTRDFYLAF